MYCYFARKKDIRKQLFYFLEQGVPLNTDLFISKEDGICYFFQDTQKVAKIFLDEYCCFVSCSSGVLLLLSFHEKNQN